ncbi:MAG: 4'-phosphopantetheinyl transferase family protein [Flavobacteriaceae bacterium]
MPFVLYQPLGAKANLWVWKIEESEELLRKGLHFHPRLQQRLAKLKAGAQRKGVLAVQQLLLKAGIDPIEMQHDAAGIPRLPSQYISISHAKGYAAIALGSTPLGVDIEQLRDQVQRITSKFVHTSENFAQTTPELIQLWTAKEAVYKAVELPGIHLSQQLLVHPFEKGTAEVCHPQKTQSYVLYFFDFDQHKATVALENT